MNVIFVDSNQCPIRGLTDYLFWFRPKLINVVKGRNYWAAEDLKLDSAFENSVEICDFKLYLLGVFPQ